MDVTNTPLSFPNSTRSVALELTKEQLKRSKTLITGLFCSPITAVTCRQVKVWSKLNRVMDEDPLNKQATSNQQSRFLRTKIYLSLLKKWITMCQSSGLRFAEDTSHTPTRPHTHTSFWRFKWLSLAFGKNDPGPTLRQTTVNPSRVVLTLSLLTSFLHRICYIITSLVVSSLAWS